MVVVSSKGLSGAVGMEARHKAVSDVGCSGQVAAELLKTKGARNISVRNFRHHSDPQRQRYAQAAQHCSKHAHNAIRIFLCKRRIAERCTGGRDTKDVCLTSRSIARYGPPFRQQGPLHHDPRCYNLGNQEHGQFPQSPLSFNWRDLR